MPAPTSSGSSSSRRVAQVQAAPAACCRPRVRPECHLEASPRTPTSSSTARPHLRPACVLDAQLVDDAVVVTIAIVNLLQADAFHPPGEPCASSTASLGRACPGSRCPALHPVTAGRSQASSSFAPCQLCPELRSVPRSASSIYLVRRLCTSEGSEEKTQRHIYCNIQS
jgi:hypothetical protein